MLYIISHDMLYIMSHDMLYIMGQDMLFIMSQEMLYIMSQDRLYIMSQDLPLDSSKPPTKLTEVVFASSVSCRYTTKHLQDETTSRTIKNMLAV